MKITSFTNAEYKNLRAKILTALKPLTEEFGVDFDIDGGRLAPNKLNLKLVAGIRDAASGQSAAEVEFRRYAAMLGLAPDDYGKTFAHGGSLYKLTGLKLSAPKFNVLTERVPDGAGYKFTADVVRKSLKTKIAA